MQWKSFFCAVLIVSPLGLMAQGPKITSDGKRLAMRESSEGSSLRNTNVSLQDSMTLKAMPFAMSSIDKTINVNSNETKPKAKSAIKKETNNSNTLTENPALKSKAASADLAIAKPMDRVMEQNDRFKAVPLAGETDYYGNMNSFMIDYVKKYMNNFGNRLITVNGRNSTFEVIDRVLKSHLIPKELKYLAVIESALNKNARSPVGAVGYWQFMAPTAKLMGLTVNGRRDDRTDLSKSTHAAAKYLSYLYDQLDDWLLVVAAYNSGPRPVINAIKRTGKSDFWAIKSYLPKETQNHVLAFVATATIMERLNHFLLPGLPSNFDWNSLNISYSGSVAAAKEKKAAHPLLSRFSEEEVKKMAIVRIKSPLDLELVCSALNIDRRQLGRWNYDYFDFLDTYKAGNTYNFRIPKDKLDAFIEKKDYLEKLSTNMQL
jgi:membrane-bound lytic murein transglycosylase D